jgi:hypothetical protein
LIPSFTNYDYGVMLATWQEHRASYMGVKVTCDMHGPFFHKQTVWFCGQRRNGAIIHPDMNEPTVIIL